MAERVVEIWSDGACRNNPGRGGWGYLLKFNAAKKELSGWEADTTNNRMELMAAIRALEALKRRSYVKLHTDSQYVVKGITIWIHDWKRRGWRTADKKPVKNEDLWRRLDALAAKHEIRWQWVKGHAGNPENEYVDRLANNAIPHETDRP